MTQPYDHGLLDVGGGDRVYWETCGNPEGKPVVFLHGGPGSGAGPSWRRLFDPRRYRAVLLDQRGCGRSTPNAVDLSTDLANNTTQSLVSDLERLREHLGVERWLVAGGSWGTTLALAYAERHPERVSELVLFSVVTTTRREVRWVTHEMGRFFPEEWARFRAAVPESGRDDLAAAYDRLLSDPDPAVVGRAAEEWCRWEDVHVRTRPGRGSDPRYRDPRFRVGFARLVTRYWANGAFLEEGELLAGAARLAGIPGVLIHGRLDLSSPLDIPWELSRAWPGSRLVVVEEAGHGAGEPGMLEAVKAALDGYL